MPEKISMDNEFIKKLIDIIEINLENEKFGVLELATEIGLSRSQLHRRLQDINGKSTSQFIREYRLQKAMDMLKQKTATASEIAYKVGFASPTYFNTCFNNYFGYPPGKVKYKKHIELPKKSLSKKVTTIIPIIIVIGLIVYNTILDKTTYDPVKTEKTIAVLPFVNDSPNEENMFFCNGIMAGIREHLAKIPEFTVVSIYTVEQYKDNLSSNKSIAKKLDVNYLVEGRVQRINDRAIISAELIRASDNKVLWSKSYDKDISEIFAVQANVTQSIANSLETLLSSNIKTQLNKIPTRDKLAIDYHLKANEFRNKARKQAPKSKAWLDLLNKSYISDELAIDQDSLFALPYLGLARTAFAKNGPYILKKNNLDEAFVNINKSLQIDSTLSYAYSKRAEYYLLTNQKDKIIKDVKKALELNPNNGHASSILLNIYNRSSFNYKKSIELLKKLEKIAESKRDLYMVYSSYAIHYSLLEQKDMVDYYFNKASKIDSTYNRNRIYYFWHTGQFDRALSYIENKYLVNDQEQNSLFALTYALMKNKSKALEYFEKWHKQVMVNGAFTFYSKFCYSAYGKALINEGQVEKGMTMIHKQLELFDKMISSERLLNPWVYLAYVELYYIIGDYEKAYESMKIFEATGAFKLPGLLAYLKLDPASESLRNDPHYIEWIKEGEKQFKEVQKQIRPYLSLKPLKQSDL